MFSYSISVSLPSDNIPLVRFQIFPEALGIMVFQHPVCHLAKAQPEALIFRGAKARKRRVHCEGFSPRVHFRLFPRQCKSLAERHGVGQGMVGDEHLAAEFAQMNAAAQHPDALEGRKKPGGQMHSPAHEQAIGSDFFARTGYAFFTFFFRETI